MSLFEKNLSRIEEISRILEAGNCLLKESEELYLESLELQKKCTSAIEKLSKNTDSKINKSRILSSIKKLSFEDSIVRLDKISEVLNNNCELEAAYSLKYESEMLKAHCDELLKTSVKKTKEMFEKYQSE